MERPELPGPAGTLVEGRFTRSRRGHGFVASAATGGDLHVAPGRQGEAIHRDRVLARVIGPGRRGMREGVIVDVLERPSTPIPGLFRADGAGGMVEPFDDGYGFRVLVGPGRTGGAKDGEAVGVLLSGDRRPEERIDGEVVERLGRPDEPGVDITILVRKYGLSTGFPTDAEAEAAALPDAPTAEEVEGRTDFTADPVVTIDGESARDFDDAIFVAARDGGGWRLAVHVADVSAYVRPDSALDAEARRRGTSVYFPDRVVPMLPERLSNGLCSLNPEVPRLVQSVVLDVGPAGAVEGATFHDGVIRSRARLTYTEVARIVEERDTAARDRRADLTPHLDRALDCARALRSRRLERGALDFDLPEPEILLDLRGEIREVLARERNEAHRVIEELMLAANEAVARRMVDERVATLFRVHERPDPRRLETLDRDLAAFGYRLPRPLEAVQPRHLQEIIRWAEGRPERGFLTRKILRSMALARYEEVCRGHFGLAASAYLHFTSPIRRYPDLLVHRHLRAVRKGGIGNGVDERRRRAALAALAADCSQLERDAEAAERESIEVLTLGYLRRHLGDEFPGVVSEVARFGLFVEIEGVFLEGLVPVERLAGRRYRLDSRRRRLVAEGGGPSYRVGDLLTVTIDRVDTFRRRVDLGLARQSARPSRGRS